MEQTAEPSLIRKPAKVFGWLVAWAWTIIAGGGGLGLLITRGPLPLTNGWFALFSGISACPLTAWLLKTYAGITIPGFENRRARHIPYRLLTMLERRLLLVFSNSEQASASSHSRFR